MDLIRISQEKLYKLVLRCLLSHLSSKWTEMVFDSAILRTFYALKETKEGEFTLAGKIRHFLP